MSRRLLVIATVAAALAVVAIELVIRWVATEPLALPASIRRTADRRDGPLPTLWSVPAYRLVDQNGQTRTAEDLRGSVWVADFIFTSCKSICPVLSAKMVQVQRAIPDARLKFVSFSVDPERDTPRSAAHVREAMGAGRAAVDAARHDEGQPRRPHQGDEDLRRAPARPGRHRPHRRAVPHRLDRGRVRGLYSTDGDSFDQLVPDARRLLGELGTASAAHRARSAGGEDGALALPARSGVPVATTFRPSPHRWPGSPAGR